MKIVRKKLNDNLEKKIKYDYKEVEKITEAYLERYNIDLIIENWLTEELTKYIDWGEVQKNLKRSKKKYIPQFGVDLFHQFNIFVEETLKKFKYDEMRYLLLKGQEFSNQFENIFDNIMETIPLTMFETGIHRTTLISYHYFLKVINRLSAQFIEANMIKNINGTKNPTELFITELYNIISKNEEMTKFTLTLKTLIEQWLIKYNNKTKIGEFYYDVLMITPEFITEKILKYMLFTAIKNKNPFVLRAIFSSYITLIHKNLFSAYATNLTKVKIGYFKQLENLFTENFDLIFDQDNFFDSRKFVVDSMLFIYINQNKRYLKPNFHLLDDEYIQFFFEPNYFDLLTSYKKNGNITFIDHMYFYNSQLKFTKNSVFKNSNMLKLNTSHFKKNNVIKNRKVVYDILYEYFSVYFYEKLKDEDSVHEIIDGMAKDLHRNLSPQFYLKSDFNQINLAYDEYLNLVEQFAILLRKLI